MANVKRWVSIDGDEALVEDAVWDDFSIVQFHLGLIHNTVFNRTLTVDWVSIGTTGYGSSDLFFWDAGDTGIPPFDTQYGGPITAGAGETYFETAPNTGSQSTYLEGAVSVVDESQIFVSASVAINIVDTTFGILNITTPGGSHNSIAAAFFDGDHWATSQTPPGIVVPQSGGDYGSLVEGQFHTIAHRLQFAPIGTGVYIKRKFRVGGSEFIPGEPVPDDPPPVGGEHYASFTVEFNATWIDRTLNGLNTITAAIATFFNGTEFAGQELHVARKSGGTDQEYQFGLGFSNEADWRFGPVLVAGQVYQVDIKQEANTTTVKIDGTSYVHDTTGIFTDAPTAFRLGGYDEPDDMEGQVDFDDIKVGTTGYGSTDVLDYGFGAAIVPPFDGETDTGGDLSIAGGKLRLLYPGGAGMAPAYAEIALP